MIGIIKKIYGIIAGGTTGQALTKASATDYDVTWTTLVPTGGTANQVLSKVDGTDYNTQWTTPSAGATPGDKVLPVALANQSILSNSYDYYFNHYINTDITVQSITYSILTNGSDNVRFAIYRGTDTSAVLVGQTASITAGSRNTGYNQANITAESGQNLTFTAGEQIVVAIASGGTTTYFYGCSVPNTNTINWYNTTDSEGTGFPTNPRAKTGSRTTIPAIELNPYTV